MPVYRAYLINRAPDPGKPHIAGPPRLLEAANEQNALRQAEQRVNGHDIELWEGRRSSLTLSFYVK